MAVKNISMYSYLKLLYFIFSAHLAVVTYVYLFFQTLDYFEKIMLHKIIGLKCVQGDKHSPHPPFSCQLPYELIAKLICLPYDWISSHSPKRNSYFFHHQLDYMTSSARFKKE
jgi:hypothetical protein